MSLPSIQRRQILKPSELGDDVHPLLQRVLAQRGITRPEEVCHELNQLVDPMLMLGMDQAVERLWQALQQQQKVIIVGDFDADGATSSALAVLLLSAYGFEQVNFMVPNRFEYGYGLSTAIVDELKWQQPDLLITVDNGISSIDGVAHANAQGMDVIITDHHLPGEQLPDACAIINPNQPGCEFPGKSLAGVGVVFYLMVALRKKLREQNWFAERGLAEPNLANYLDLVALGSVADVVPLDFYNRVLVAQGIKRMRAGLMRPGVRALLQVAGKDFRSLASTDLGFTLGPRLNAAGRLDDMTQGIMLLLTESEDLALELAQALDGLNRDRRSIEQQMQKEALQIVEQMSAELDQIPRGFCLHHPEWHQGVVGLVASRLKEKFHRPVIAFANADGDDPGELKGSGRSIQGIHLRDLLDEIATANPGLLNKFGGHAMAAGLSLQQEDFERFHRAYLTQLDAIADASLFEPVIETDGEVMPAEMNLFTAQLLRDAMPWGQAMPEPGFDGEFHLLQQRLVGERHLKLKVGFTDDLRQGIDAIHFNCDLEQWPDNSVSKVRLVYRLAVNEFRGQQSLQLMVDAIYPLC